jgi:putative transposase
MASSTIFGAQSISRGCPAKCFGYGEVVDVYLQSKKNEAAAKRFVRRLLRLHGVESSKIVTDKLLSSYPVAHPEVIPAAICVTDRYANN